MATLFKKKEKNQESTYLASQWQLMWIKLKKHKLSLNRNKQNKKLHNRHNMNR